MEKAQRLYVIVGRPSQKVFEDMHKKGKLVNNNYNTRLPKCNSDLW